MTPWLFIAFGVFLLFLVIWVACRMASDADDLMEREAEQERAARAALRCGGRVQAAPIRPPAETGARRRKQAP